ncbi:beta-ketoacyl synthase N-terminal-like domain-containing protein [Trichocoleus sp. DQ-U1]|uniref:beta-ketoacyl synthase N-terminal-like domain-containing protein n=1 Tax=Trichocoleus sp. DQ-U1 TaxID=2933926 RepID=UPI00329A1B74
MITFLTNCLRFSVLEEVLKSSSLLDEDTQQILKKNKLIYIGWKENYFPGTLGNIMAQWIAKRLNLSQINCIVNAASASSLTGVQMAISKLAAYRSFMILVWGVDTDNSIFMHMCFSKIHTFSKQQKIKLFNADFDGMLFSEAIGMMVLKRLKDAQNAPLSLQQSDKLVRKIQRLQFMKPLIAMKIRHWRVSLPTKMGRCFMALAFNKFKKF